MLFRSRRQKPKTITERGYCYEKAFQSVIPYATAFTATFLANFALSVAKAKTKVAQAKKTKHNNLTVRVAH